MAEDRKLWIALAQSRYNSTLRNELWGWADLCARMKAGIQTSETAEEYRRMKKHDQDQVKDKGGFVGGYLQGGKRSARTVEVRSMVTLDFDGFSAGQLMRLEEEFKGRAWALYSTHKHTEQEWRVRIVIPLSRDVSADEYAPVARKIAEKIGFPGIDRTTFEPSRLMFWGSYSLGSPYMYREGTGRFVNADRILGEYRDWGDASAWPLLPEEQEAGLWVASPRMSACIGKLSGKGTIEDPTQKKGLIGAFCRAYDIPAVIAKYLPNIYTPMKGHFHHEGSSAGASARNIENKWLYSFHATDPASNRALNAWDLVRIHKFGDDPAQGPGKTASRKAMEELAMQDKKVRDILVRESRKSLEDFGDISAEEDIEERDALKEWEEERNLVMKCKKNGDYESTAQNIRIVMTRDPRIAGKVRYNEFSGEFEVFGDLPWKKTKTTWGGDDDKELRHWIELNYGIRGASAIDDCFVSVARQNGYHPIKSYLESLEWDGVKRLGRIFIDVLGAEDTALNSRIAELFFTAAVRRIYQPGIKFECMPILVGREGTGKSSVAQIMGGEWFSNSVSVMEGKEGMECVQGHWIIEMGELNGWKKSDESAQKDFISKESDDYRGAYERRSEKRPRQCVFIGTTNETVFLRGVDAKNRRFPIVEIKPELRDADLGEPRQWLIRWRDQLWAEAVELEKREEQLYLGPEFDAETKRIQDLHNIDLTNGIWGEVEEFLERPVPPDYEKMSKDHRINWYRDNYDIRVGQLTGIGLEDRYERRETVCIKEIIHEGLQIGPNDRYSKSQALQISQWLSRKGSGWRKMEKKQRRGCYGPQWTWERESEPFDGLSDM